MFDGYVQVVFTEEELEREYFSFRRNIDKILWYNDSFIIMKLMNEIIMGSDASFIMNYNRNEMKVGLRKVLRNLTEEQSNLFITFS